MANQAEPSFGRKLKAMPGAPGCPDTTTDRTIKKVGKTGRARQRRFYSISRVVDRPYLRDPDLLRRRVLPSGIEQAEHPPGPRWRRRVVRREVTTRSSSSPALNAPQLVAACDSQMRNAKVAVGRVILNPRARADQPTDAPG